jgi:hypothetical protein
MSTKTDVWLCSLLLDNEDDIGKAEVKADLPDLASIDLFVPESLTYPHLKLRQAHLSNKPDFCACYHRLSRT